MRSSSLGKLPGVRLGNMRVYTAGFQQLYGAYNMQVDHWQKIYETKFK